MSEDRKKYNYMENDLQRIINKHISLEQTEERRINEILSEILDSIIAKMKQKNKLFDCMYSRLFYGGSYYDGLKIGRPDEFDLDLLLLLPKISMPVIDTTKAPGFVNVQLQTFDRFLKQPEAEEYEKLDDLLDDEHYILTHKVLSWMESVVNKALNTFPKDGKESLFSTSKGEFKGFLVKGGPALTLKLQDMINFTKIDIDLVPCFVFTKDKWPREPYRQNSTKKNEFFIVPKQPQGNLEQKGRFWRLSFQEQERAMMNDLRQLKPAAKLLKLLRDNENCPVASYYIKTIFLWQIEMDVSLFTGYSLSYVFMIMLKKFQKAIGEECIRYFWHEDFNLLGLNSIALQNISNRLLSIIKNIDKNLGDPSIITDYLDKKEKVLQSYSPNAISIPESNPPPSRCIIL